eukprot:gene31910-54301_t
MLNKVVIFGVGLIGGSFARALKQAGAARHVVGMDRSPVSLQRALELGLALVRERVLVPVVGLG